MYITLLFEITYMQDQSNMNQKSNYILVIKKNKTKNLTLNILRKCSVWYNIHVLMHIHVTRSYACISATIDMEWKKCTNR